MFFLFCDENRKRNGKTTSFSYRKMVENRADGFTGSDLLVRGMVEGLQGFLPLALAEPPKGF